ncbi:hypothetical protein KIH27_03500 [Mycobacterium sp. M1]|uniref:Uncharacterized protein n=1 Tax=Mycolicibacter acidiphilus TaxID=2835306 RepID=A0ABS5REN1_9MYCO|nr:hypothetical protein [Mycolicibacter acidiphilus]MBS9532649.1 hypothetical protein [Mycolicibacter acidiphilus]
MFTVELQANCSDAAHAGNGYVLSRIADDRAGAEEIAREELRRQGVPADQIESALANMRHYSAADVVDDLHAPAFTPESGAHDFTLRILES